MGHRSAIACLTVDIEIGGSLPRTQVLGLTLNQGDQLKQAFGAVAFCALCAPAQAVIIYSSIEAFEQVVGSPQQWIDFSEEVLPGCADASYYAAFGEVIGNNCVASSTTVQGQRVYTMRAQAWLPEILIRSGGTDGTVGGLFVYGAHLWNGPETFLRADPLGGDRLAIEFYRPFLTLGVHTTEGFFGWLPTLATEDPLVLPAGAQISRLDFNYRQAVVSEPASLALVAAGLAGLLLRPRRRAQAV